jgi:rubrerythrin
MRKLKYTFMSAADVKDPRKRAQMLATAALEEVETVLLVAKALHLAEKAAREVEDPALQERTLEKLQLAMERSGYDIETRTFAVREIARQMQQTPNS